MASLFISGDEAAEKIKDRCTLWLEGGSGGLNEPDTLYECVPKRFRKAGHPRDITLVHSNGLGDGQGKGPDVFAIEGLVQCSIGGHYGFCPAIVKMINANKIEAYNLPQGVMAQLLRDTAAKRPGLITTVGLETFVDPRLTGGALNSISKRKLVEILRIEEKEYLFYKSIPIDVAFIRGTTADEDGNISMEEEVGYFNMLSAAQAAHNNGGLVIAQVKRVVRRDTIDTRIIKVPGVIVDYVVVEPNQWQSYVGEYNPGLCGAGKMVVERQEKIALDERKIVCRRAAMELVPGIINLGFGMSSGVADVAFEEGLDRDVTFAIEQGLVGGIPASGLIFGCAMNPQAILDQPYQFDFFDGGGIEMTCLGLAQVDPIGNVNVSKFGDRIAGVGGFVNITQGAKGIVFCGTLTAGGLKVAIENARVVIHQEGKIKKFVKKVEHLTFSGPFSLKKGQTVLYVTERGVFQLGAAGLTLIEIAPGVDLKKEILSQMEFTPQISPNLKEMDLRIFREEPMGIREEILKKRKRG